MTYTVVVRQFSSSLFVVTVIATVSNRHILSCSQEFWFTVAATFFYFTAWTAQMATYTGIEEKQYVVHASWYDAQVTAAVRNSSKIRQKIRLALTYVSLSAAGVCPVQQHRLRRGHLLSVSGVESQPRGDHINGSAASAGLRVKNPWLLLRLPLPVNYIHTCVVTANVGFVANKEETRLFIMLHPAAGGSSDTIVGSSARIMEDETQTPRFFNVDFVKSKQGILQLIQTVILFFSYLERVIVSWISTFSRHPRWWLCASLPPALTTGPSASRNSSSWQWPTSSASSPRASSSWRMCLD